jgi:uncharacterized protein (TIGR03435 family)
MGSRRSVFIILFCAAVAFGQEFEVASIRLASQDAQNQTSAGIHTDGSTVRYSAVDLRLLLGIANHLKSYQISAPDWMVSERWDITARLPENADSKQIPAMLQALLRDRFQMKTHREARDLPVYGLAVDKGGLKMKASSDDAAPSGAAAGQSVDLQGQTVNYGNGSSLTFGENKLEGKKFSITSLADVLSRFADRPVIDMTGLTGEYDFTMEFSAEDFRAMMTRAAIAQGTAVSPEAVKFADASASDTLFSAIEILGLKLEPRKAPMEMLVVDDSLKTPTEN